MTNWCIGFNFYNSKLQGATRQKKMKRSNWRAILAQWAFSKIAAEENVSISTTHYDVFCRKIIEDPMSVHEKNVSRNALCEGRFSNEEQYKLVSRIFSLCNDDEANAKCGCVEIITGSQFFIIMRQIVISIDFNLMWNVTYFPSYLMHIM